MRILTLTALIALCSLSLASEMTDAQLQTEFEEFQLEYGRKYKNKLEEDHRFQIFKKNRLTVHEHNKQNEFNYEVEVNKFPDKEVFELKGGLLSGFQADLKGKIF